MRSQHRMEKKTYPAPYGGKRFWTGAMLFLSCVVLFAGFLSRGTSRDDLTVVPSVTPAPTQVMETFDETPDSREITIPARAWYAIQLGVYENQDAARQQAESFISRGAAGYVFEDGGRYRVLAAVYPAQEDAKTVRGQLKDQHEIDSYVYTLNQPELVLRMSGMAGQLDALEAALTFLPQAAVQLQAMSIALDQREADTSRTASDLSGLYAQAQTLFTLLESRFPSPRHTLVDGLLKQLKNLQTRITGLGNRQLGLVELAAALKYETLASIGEVNQFLQSIT